MTSPASFNTLSLRSELLSNLTAIGYDEMTRVQAEALPALLSGADVSARAKTGSGKTAAFGLGLLNKLDATTFAAQALVLCPTRELADQVTKELRRLAREIPNVKVLTLCGGASLGPQLASLQRPAHIVVGTPGRILKLLRKGNLSFPSLQTLVLDEADRMLDMGFTDDIDAIIKQLPKQRQTALFSATYPNNIATIGRRIQNDPITVDVTESEQPAAIEQRWCSVTRESRDEALLRVIRAWGGALNIVFCNTKIECAAVAQLLIDDGVAAVALHGALEQHQRNEMLVRFGNRSASVMVATDVAARGLDIDDLDVVFNYELPKQAEVFVHRIGRTGRAGREGLAVSLVESRELRRWRDIESMLPSALPAESALPASRVVIPGLRPAMTTVHISGGRKNKLRPGDLLGALTAKGGIAGKSVGSIDLFDTYGYVAVLSADAKQAVQQLANRPIKGRRYRARIIR
ncbi:MAG: ATP-dependent RNA helicase DbpA [Pseudomonadota bacterium]